MTFRPDYEVPLAAVLDTVLALPDVDDGRVALAGQSFGSYFAARSAATDLRVGALVANPPVVDMGRYMEAWVGTDVYRMVRDIRPEDVAGVPEDLMPRQMQWGIEAICTRFGVPSFHAWRDAMASYRLGDLTGSISCPVLAMVGEREGAEPRAQFDALVAGVTGPVTSRVFRPADGASTHCQSDNLRLSAQVTFDWLDAELGGARSGGPPGRAGPAPGCRSASGQSGWVARAAARADAPASDTFSRTPTSAVTDAHPTRPGRRPSRAPARPAPSAGRRPRSRAPQGQHDRTRRCGRRPARPPAAACARGGPTG